MKHVQFKSSVITKALQLKPDNFYEVYQLLVSEVTNITTISVQHLIPTRMYGSDGRPFGLEGLYANPSRAGIDVEFTEGSSLKVNFLDWVVVSEIGGIKHVVVYDSYEFPALFDINKNDSKENSSFNMSLLGNNNIQSVFENPNDYRLFTYIANTYCNQLSEKGVKNNIIELKTSVVMGICKMSDKTFRKSRNNLIEMGVIYPSHHGYKISFETLNNLISK